MLDAIPVTTLPINPDFGLAPKCTGNKPLVFGTVGGERTFYMIQEDVTHIKLSVVAKVAGTILIQMKCGDVDTY